MAKPVETQVISSTVAPTAPRRCGMATLTMERVDGPHERAERDRDGHEPLVDGRAGGLDGREGEGRGEGGHSAAPTPSKKTSTTRSASASVHGVPRGDRASRRRGAGPGRARGRGRRPRPGARPRRRRAPSRDRRPAGRSASTRSRGPPTSGTPPSAGDVPSTRMRMNVRRRTTDPRYARPSASSATRAELPSFLAAVASRSAESSSMRDVSTAARSASRSP